MRKGSIRDAVIGVALFASAHSADAHGIAGNRFFVRTLTFDDPSVADEAIVANFSTLNHPVEGGNATDNRFDWSFTRLLTPVLQIQVDSGWIHRNWPTARTSGFATTDVGIKSEIYRNNQHGWPSPSALRGRIAVRGDDDCAWVRCEERQGSKRPCSHCRNSSLGLVPTIQHLLPNQPFYTWSAANPTRQPLEPEATGAAMEVTKWLKPSESVSRNTVTARVCRP